MTKFSSSFFLDLLDSLQGLCDSEEFVICKALTALTSLIELGLLQKPVILDLGQEIVPNLCHPVSLGLDAEKRAPPSK